MNNFSLTNINSFTLNTQAVNDNQVITKSYVDLFHLEKRRSRQKLGKIYYNESSDLVRKNQQKIFNDTMLTKMDRKTVNGEPIRDNDLAKKIC